MYKTVSLLLLFTLFGCKSNPDSRAVSPLVEQTESQMIADLAEELQLEHQSGTFDGVVLVTKNEAVLYKSAYGYANREAFVKNGKHTISDIGSIAKTFTAAAVLQLSQKQTLALSDTVGVFYPNAPVKLKPITISQLLSHTSGLDNFHNDSDFEAMSKAEAEQRILSMPLIAMPGEKIAYSNAAYTLLAAIVEKVTHQSFQDYVHKNLLAPLDLDNTGFYQDAEISISSVARGYGGDNQGSTTFERELTWALIGAGGMVSSIDDLASWFAALRAGTLFPANTPNLALTEANKRWLLGSLALRDISGEAVIQMGGSTDFGYTALLQFVPKQELVIILLLNAHNGKYATATHHQLSRKHILPALLSQQAKSPDKSIQPSENALAD